jgi:glucosamine--fructose-6-phosphate aminotransferase (isomerizing)
MCGIIGYKGLREDAFEVAFNGLKRLEYRGYDSWGIALKDNPTGKIWLVKKTGKVRKPPSLKSPRKSHLSVGHTRWATHGGVTEQNAHPHLSCDGDIAIVHNGIIENYQQLREKLKARGHRFSSETDSEVIAHLVEEYYKNTGDFSEAGRNAALELEGTFAIVAINQNTNELIGIKNESPLVAGIGNGGEFFLGSDIPAFMEHTRNALFLDDYELISFNDSYRIINYKTGKTVKKNPAKITWKLEDAGKGRYEHFMLKEISEQGETIARALSHSDEELAKAAKRINSAKGVFFIACGSSYHAALTGSYMFSRITRKHINVLLASEFPYYEHFLTKDTLVIAISQSGETADVMSAVKAAKRKGTKVMAIVNVMGSSLMRAADYSLMMNAGPEICVLSTKTYTSQLSLLILLAYACARKLHTGRKLLENIRPFVHETPRQQRALVDLAHKLKNSADIFTIGRGINFPTALEAALKIKEVSYIHAEGFAGGELKHGTMALIEQGTPCIVFAPQDDTLHDTLSNATEVKARGAYIIGVSPENNEIFDVHIPVPKDGITSPITNIVPVQLLAYYLAVLRECDPDKPRNLAKSVTVR